MAPSIPATESSKSSRVSHDHFQRGPAVVRQPSWRTKTRTAMARTATTRTTTTKTKTSTSSMTRTSKMMTARTMTTRMMTA